VALVPGSPPAFTSASTPVKLWRLQEGLKAGGAGNISNSQRRRFFPPCFRRRHPRPLSTRPLLSLTKNQRGPHACLAVSPTRFLGGRQKSTVRLCRNAFVPYGLGKGPSPLGWKSPESAGPPPQCWIPPGFGRQSKTVTRLRVFLGAFYNGLRTKSSNSQKGPRGAGQPSKRKGVITI